MRSSDGIRVGQVSPEIFRAGLFAIRAIASGKLVDMIPSKNAIYSVGLCPGTEFGSQLSIHGRQHRARHGCGAGCRDDGAWRFEPYVGSVT